MTDELEYVVKDALMICDKGAAPGFFRPTHNMHIKISGCLVTNRMDMLPVVNIPTFGVCACTGCACMPAPTMWQKTYKAKVKGQETLLARSYMPCALGGKIQFVTSGQIPLPPDALEDIKELQENGEQEEEEGWGWLDTLELVPVVGSIVGAVREGMKGNWGMMAMNIGFLVMDVAGIVSLGATTAAATAGKAAVKAGVKVAAKTAAKTVAKQTGKTGLKTGLKLTAKGAAKTFTKSIDKIIGKASMGKLCVFACFPAGTKVHTDEGLKNIEDIRAGDRVWSYNEETGEQSLQEVLQTNVRESDHTVELYTDGEKIETTAEHPFYTEEGWKDAADLQAGDRIVSRSGNPIEIKEVSFQYNPKKVYNFEVSNWHTYFVGALAWLVHNAKKCASNIFKISRKKYPNHVKLIEDAIKDGHPTKLRRGAGKKAAKKNRYEAQKPIRKKQGNPKTGYDYDEYPYASTQQGGKGAKVKEVPSSENQAVGRDLGRFYRENEIRNGDQFSIEIID
ncbi:polymorphic toxin-type HINT domain-containing protein [Porphyromonas gulae]|uniref:polymorphic toxin-type HINT domain-containing protein n=1 Tax=Porphyromonas gulae TaxID=111105 RepID=UPI0009B8D7B2|nr:polymorphic toxin-type HINT domain-containing protein [Porphyromonas gulae]